LKTYHFEFGSASANGEYTRLRTCRIEAASVEEAIEVAEEAAALAAALPHVSLLILLNETSEIVFMKSLRPDREWPF
jgi:hypothetical protein